MNPMMTARSVCLAWVLVMSAFATIVPATGSTATGPQLQVPIHLDWDSQDPKSIGAARVVTVGVPIPPSLHLKNVQSLGFTGSSAAQFRPTQRDPLTGDIRWVIAHFLTDAPDQRYALTTGQGDFGGEALAHETVDEVIVSTSKARFSISKKHFVLLNELSIDGQTLWDHNDLDGIVMTLQGERYTSKNDPACKVEIEENGPVRAVIRGQGTLTNSTGAGALGYTARLEFDKNTSEVRIEVTVRNADRTPAAVKPFDAAWVELPLGLAGERRVTFGTTRGAISASMAPDDVAWLYQGDNPSLRAKRTGRILKYLTSDTGFEVQIGKTKTNSLGTNADYSHGWAQVESSKSSFQMGMRELAALFPSGFRIAGDQVAIEMFSPRNTQKSLLFAWGAHETRVMRFRWSLGSADPTFKERLLFPVLARCSYEHYRATGAIYGEKRLVTVEEEQRFFAQQGHAWSPPRLTQRKLKIKRQFSFSTTGGGNQFDQDFTRLLDYLRTGERVRFNQARLGVQWKADQAVVHSDNFDYSQYQRGIDKFGTRQPKTFHGKGAGSNYDDEHPHWISLPLYYYLTGEERIRDAIEDYGEWREYRSGNPIYGARSGRGMRHFRVWSRALRDFALLYDVTGKESYLQNVKRMSDSLLLKIERGTSRGRNKERGYFYFGKPENPKRRVHLFFLTEIHPPAVLAALRVLPPDDPRREGLRDYLTGVAWFALREAQVSRTARGYPYGYYLGSIKKNKPGKRGDQTGLLLIHGYDQTGNLEFLNRARALAWRVQSYQHRLRASELATQAVVYRWLHPNDIEVTTLSPESQLHADGSYTLSWDSIPGAREYIVRYAASPLVENLDFDPVGQTFRIDPGSATNQWAAYNLAQEPAPDPHRDRMVLETPALPSGAKFFQVQVFLDASAF